jgi:hypothetical protein
MMQLTIHSSVQQNSKPVTNEILFVQEEMQQLNLDDDLNMSKMSSLVESVARQSSQITRPYDTSMRGQNEGLLSILRHNSILNTQIRVGNHTINAAATNTMELKMNTS